MHKAYIALNCVHFIQSVGPTKKKNLGCCAVFVLRLHKAYFALNCVHFIQSVGHGLIAHLCHCDRLVDVLSLMLSSDSDLI
jgi:hypothetical protein